jgi:membrane dipeptidase
VGITFAGVFVDAEPERVTVPRIVDHIERFVGLLGAEHVGIGSDFDGFTRQYGMAFASSAELPLLTAEMLRRGMSRETIAMVMGGSWLRVLEGFLG